MGNRPIYTKAIAEIIKKVYAHNFANFDFNTTYVPNDLSKTGKVSRYSLVPSTAGSTVEKEAVASRKYSREENLLTST